MPLDNIELKPYLPSQALVQSAQALTQILRAPDKSGVLRKQTRGRVDPRRVHRAKLGSLDFRKQSWKQKGFTTAVGILIDWSGSMGGSYYDLAAIAQAAARAILTVVDNCGNPAGCWAFSDNGSSLTRTDRDDTMIDKGSTQPWGALSSRHQRDNQHPKHSLDPEKALKHGRGIQSNYHLGHQAESDAALIELKAFDQNMKQAHKQLSTCHEQMCVSSTPSANGMVGVADILAAKEADRRVMLVLTDGDDNNGSFAIRYATKYANQVGVETIGICLKEGVGNNHRSHIQEGDYNAFGLAGCDSRGFLNRPATLAQPCVLPEADPLAGEFFRKLIDQMGGGLTRNKVVRL
jgi:hypothetical protein